MALTGKIVIKNDLTYTSSADLSTPTDNLFYQYLVELTNGTGANQATIEWSDERTITGSSSDTLDLVGALTTVFGKTITFTAIKAIFILPSSSNANNLTVGGGNFATWVADPSDKVVVVPGGALALVNPSAAGYAVTSSSGDVLTINNLSATASTYKIILVGIGSVA